jgi:hypothetical protein
VSGLPGQLTRAPEPWMARGAGGRSERGPRTGPTERCPGEIPEPDLLPAKLAQTSGREESRNGFADRT